MDQSRNFRKLTFMYSLKYLITALFLISCSVLVAQDDPMKILEQEETKVNPLTIATFKTTRIINMHTIETCGKRTLDFRIAHRFGPVNSGVEDFWGLDGGASIRLGLEYSYDGRLQIGIGRTSYQKMLDGFAKYRLLRQTENGSMPLSITLFSSMYYTTQKDPNKTATGIDKYENSSSRMSYVHQAIIGRKFGSKFSAQIAPYFVHYNQVDKITDLNDIYGIAGAFRFKFSRSMALTAEYAYNLNDYSRDSYYNSLGIGIEIETGGHVFQMHFTNSFGLAENQFLPYTNNKWDNAGIRLGFNISRVFTI
jgi:hypothetical protein